MIDNSFYTLVGLFLTKLYHYGNVSIKTEIISWKVRAHGVYARVVDISEIERVSAANEWDFFIQNKVYVKTIQSTFHAVICLFYTYWDFSALNRFGKHVHIALKCFIVIMKEHKMEVHENITLF